MVDPGHVFRRALSRLPSWLPSNFVSVDQAALQAPSEFSSTDHLSAEAVAAYVDGELPMKIHTAGGRAPVAVPAVRRGDGRPGSGPRGAAGFPAGDHAQQLDGIAVGDSAIGSRRAAGPAPAFRAAEPDGVPRARRKRR